MATQKTNPFQEVPQGGFGSTNDASNVLSDASLRAAMSQVGDQAAKQFVANIGNAPADIMTAMDSMLGTVVAQQTDSATQKSVTAQALDSFMFTPEQQAHPTYGAYASESTKMIELAYELAGERDPLKALNAIRNLAKKAQTQG